MRCSHTGDLERTCQWAICVTYSCPINQSLGFGEFVKRFPQQAVCGLRGRTVRGIAFAKAHLRQALSEQCWEWMQNVSQSQGFFPACAHSILAFKKLGGSLLDLDCDSPPLATQEVKKKTCHHWEGWVETIEPLWWEFCQACLWISSPRAAGNACHFFETSTIGESALHSHRIQVWHTYKT